MTTTMTVIKADIPKMLKQMETLLMRSPDDAILLIKGSSGSFSCPDRTEKGKKRNHNHYEMGSIIIAEDAFRSIGDNRAGVEPLIDRVSWTIVYKPIAKGGAPE